MNLFMAFPELAPDAKMLGVLCDERQYCKTPQLQPLDEHLHNLLCFLVISQSHSVLPKVAIEIGALEDGIMPNLLNFLKSIARFGLRLELALRMKWPSVAHEWEHPCEPDLEQYTKLRKHLKQTGHHLDSQGGWLKVFVVTRWCCINDECPLPAPCSAYEIKLISHVPSEDPCVGCKMSDFLDMARAISDL